MASGLHLTAGLRLASCHWSIPHASQIYKLTIKGPDTRKVQLPALILAVNLAQISNEKGILFAGEALAAINPVDALAQGLTDEVLRGHYSMLVEVVMVLREAALL